MRGKDALWWALVILLGIFAPGADTYYCEACGWCSRRGSNFHHLMSHVRVAHNVHVNLGYNRRDPHWSFCWCNDCPRKNGHGKRLRNEEEVLKHLREEHEW